MECRRCGEQVALPFRCPYCEGYFCSEHRLPENHQCPRIEQARAPKKEVKPVVLQAHARVTKRIRFSNREIRHLAIAALLVAGIGLSWSYSPPAFGGVQLLAISVVIFVMSFLTHEIAHKIAAQRQGLWAEFRIILTGAILTLISIVLPFKIISPGAVMVSGFVDAETNGRISIAGPLTNIILSIIFLLGVFPFRILPFRLGAIINAYIALFNLIPLGILDGFKVFSWNRAVWGLAFSVSIILALLSLFL